MKDTAHAYTLEEIETLGTAWTNQFAAARGWEQHDLHDPAYGLDVFFDKLSGVRVLDSGCGWARYTYRFLDEGIDYTGLDISTEMLAVAKEDNPGVRFVEGSHRKMPFSSGSYDGLWSCCALSWLPKEHIVAVLAEHLRVLVPDGVAFFIMPYCCDSYEMMVMENDTPQYHQSVYDLDEFADFLRQAGFVLNEFASDDMSGAMYFLARKPR